MTTYKQQFSLVIENISDINDDLLNPNEVTWGPMTQEDADDYFNTDDCEWGTKSSEMLDLAVEERQQLQDLALEYEDEGNWVNGIIPNCEKCGKKFAEDGHNYNERDGDEICDDCEEEEEKPKCNYCDSVSVIEWKEWGVWLCGRCAIHNNKQLKKLIDSCK